LLSYQGAVRHGHGHVQTCVVSLRRSETSRYSGAEFGG
jgi:hypothetical protein